ncbi:hypothetical protein O7614_01575 [Micromonospora sp. WMMD961]|uniref:hypothetical protein n=1 Tax=Micromonospora sp. WMMD961 TaxID=3016100 RepID=UPI002415E278|nr:hypothetical protein [Micromonospora sp. WMMD961]MDG4778335.1 hypothetical protein [Micromonospora sp. WMMD961]
METWRFVAAATMMVTIGLIGVALATNFRGVTEWHIRRSMATASVLRRVPPWRWLADAEYDERLARFVLLERAMGVIFAAASVMFLIVLVHGVLSGEPMPSSR